MKILEILKTTTRENIYLEDLNFFETELATGDYAEAYIAECKEQIKLVRSWLSGEDEVTAQPVQEEKTPEKRSKAALVMGIPVNPVTMKTSPKDIIFWIFNLCEKVIVINLSLSLSLSLRVCSRQDRDR